MNNRNRNILIALLVSLLFHFGLFYLMDFYDWLVITTKNLSENIPSEITVVFPENKPQPAEKEMYIVDNQNESGEKPDDSNLLSEKNSRAANPEQSQQFAQNTPLSEGNVDFSELSRPPTEQTPFQPYNYKPFSSAALIGKQVNTKNNDEGVDKILKENEQQQNMQSSEGTNQKFNQQKFSVEEVGSLSLSTYAWEWAPFIQKLKNKHKNVWYAPPAYTQLGLISGYTKIVFEIGRNGNLIRADVIDHQGHESLRTASEASIKAIFPFIPLPDDFPDETLTITATLIYPDLRKYFEKRR